MNRHFYEVAARDRAADWRREADRDRLVELRPRRVRALPARLMTIVRSRFGGRAIEGSAPRPAVVQPDHQPPAPARLIAATPSSPPSRPQGR
jgi:hypothetical protein